MTVTMEDRPLFENEEWAVMESGLEHKRTGYFIGRDEVASRHPDGLWSWPVHMAEKSWCNLPAFTEAFTCAAAVYGIPTDADLARSFNLARCDIAPQPEAAGTRRLSGHGPAAFPASPPGDWAPIAHGLGWAGRPAKNSSRAASPPVEWQSDPGPTERRALTLNGRVRWPHPDSARTMPWSASRRIRRAGARIVWFLRTAWKSGRASPAATERR